ncbi:hypothetical protein [Spirosoma agri]|nr:hypothetical protein [Spirosoma agri]
MPVNTKAFITAAVGGFYRLSVRRFCRNNQHALSQRSKPTGTL